MTRKDFENLMSELLKPLGFRKKRHKWYLDGEVLNKIVELQKSMYGDMYYINYGYIFKDLELDTFVHIFRRLGSSDKDEQKRILRLLNFENNIPDEVRKAELIELIKKNMLRELESVHTAEDVYRLLQEKPFIKKMLPLKVKKYLGVE